MFKYDFQVDSACPSSTIAWVLKLITELLTKNAVKWKFGRARNSVGMRDRATGKRHRRKQMNIIAHFADCNIKVRISSKFLFSYLILYITQWTSAKENSIWVKCNLFRSFNNIQICRHFGPHSHQSSLGLEWVVT